MLLQLEKVSETSFPAIWRPKIQKISLRCPPWEHFLFMQTVKKLNLCGRTVADKSAWIKAWLHFSHLPLTALKMKIPKQWQKGLEISFYTSVPQIICYTVPEIWQLSDVIVIFLFGQFLALLPSKQPKKWKKKNTWRYQR